MKMLQHPAGIFLSLPSFNFIFFYTCAQKTKIKQCCPSRVRPIPRQSSCIITREGLFIHIFTARVSLAFHHRSEGAVLPSSDLPAAFEAQLSLLRWFADPEDVWESDDGTGSGVLELAGSRGRVEMSLGLGSMARQVP